MASLFLLTSVAALINGHAVVHSHDAAAAEAIAAQVDQHATLKRDLARVEGQRVQAGVPSTRLQPGLPSAGAVEARLNTFRAALPPLPIAVIGAGRTQLVPQRYEVRGGGGARFWPFGRTVGTNILSGLTPEQSMDNPTASILGMFDLTFVAVYLSPLLILALTYDVVSRDREAGVLAFIAAQPITFREWLAIRVGVRAAVITVFGVLLPGMGTAFTMAEWFGDASVRLALWCVGVLAYSAIWLLLAVAVSVYTRASAVGAVVSVAIWLATVIVVPALLGLATPFLAPTSTRLAYATEERAASLDINARVDAGMAALNQLIRTRLSARPEAAGDHPTFTEPVTPPVGGELLLFPQSPWSAPTSVVHLARGFAEARRTLVEQRLAPVLAQLDADERREATFAAVAQFSSPALLLQTIGEEVAGVGHVRWKRFLGQLDLYARQRDAFFSGKVLSNTNVTSHELDARLAPFRYNEEPMPHLVERIMPAIVALITMAATIGAFCARSVRRWRM